MHFHNRDSSFHSTDTAQNSPDSASYHENDKPPSSPSVELVPGQKGRLAGGKYLQPSTSHHEHFTTLDFDFPLTGTKAIVQGGKQYILIDYTFGDKENPFNWSPWKKALVSGLLCLMTLFIGLATTAYSSGITRMCADLGVSLELGQMGLFTFNMTCALAPLFLAPFCELAGRRIVYAGAYVGFSIMFIGLALGKNIATILVCRALLGLFGCVGTILVGGTFGDMYHPEDRAIPMASFSYVAILGTVAAPIYAGFIDETIGWRWIEGIQGLANVPLMLIIVFFFPETRGSMMLSKRAKILRSKTGDQRYVALNDLEAPNLKRMLYNSSVKAVKMLITEPVVFFFGLWISFAWFLTFLFLSVIPITYEEKKGWSEGVAGLPYIALCIGTTLGFMMHFLQIHKYNTVHKDKTDEEMRPEARLYGVMFGAVALPIGLFIYSFTQYAYVHWIGPMIGLGLITFGIFFIFESCYSFTSDCYGETSSSAIAGQGFMRNTLGAVSPLFASQFFHNVGSQYAGLILSIIAAFLTAIPYVLFVYGPAIRSRSKLASVPQRRPSSGL
ncbi:hypothetical protein DTO006G1_2007 [Penicillium roqueforti]|nr:hypothetical protein CBS147337_3826 [Penicillium roqueforti]KAI2694832.1 hypothetical protein CBS147372_9596 [Penicillium roqueforti]KAI2712261.1 hypothetical protein CBS147354_8133 [Penicillium roqueforti]KAI2720591.1 hypothetical protein CBS147332_3831 [Penicillium roqueforti]KAI2762868.1 hypothetical protein DTO006G1_2007 [Penicillium roqueforti]